MAKVALEEGRSAIGIDLNPEYCEMARKRVAPAANQMRLEIA
jgi:DNA modification methylase